MRPLFPYPLVSLSVFWSLFFVCFRQYVRMIIEKRENPGFFCFSWTLGNRNNLDFRCQQTKYLRPPMLTAVSFKWHPCFRFSLGMHAPCSPQNLPHHFGRALVPRQPSPRSLGSWRQREVTWKARGGSSKKDWTAWRGRGRIRRMTGRGRRIPPRSCWRGQDWRSRWNSSREVFFRREDRVALFFFNFS